jgi:hypothetical protein
VTVRRVRNRNQLTARGLQSASPSPSTSFSLSSLHRFISSQCPTSPNNNETCCVAIARGVRRCRQHYRRRHRTLGRLSLRYVPPASGLWRLALRVPRPSALHLAWSEPACQPPRSSPSLTPVPLVNFIAIPSLIGSVLRTSSVDPGQSHDPSNASPRPHPPVRDLSPTRTDRRAQAQGLPLPSVQPMCVYPPPSLSCGHLPLASDLRA